MSSAPYPSNEAQRQMALDSYGILDTLPEQRYDDLTDLAAYICDTPIALISLIDNDRQWFKSHHGLSMTQSERAISFCAHSLLNPEDIMVVSNAHTDHRFADNPLVRAEPNIHFYAGAPLLTPEKLPLGTICVISHTAKMLSEHQVNSLRALARQTMALLEFGKLEKATEK